MRIIQGDIWKQRCTSLVIPSNLDGVMGRGLAHQTLRLYPDSARSLMKLARTGQLREMYDRRELHVSSVYNSELGFRFDLIFLPIKDKWFDYSTIPQVRHSLEILRGLISARPEECRCLVPLLGCGYGELTKEDVLPVVEELLADDVYSLILPDSSLAAAYPQSFREGVNAEGQKIQHNITKES